jgi:hypothetical protein
MRLLEIEDCMEVEEELSNENEPMSERLHRLHYDRERALGPPLSGSRKGAFGCEARVVSTSRRKLG